MKNTIKVLGIISLMLVIGFSFAACSDGGDGGGGTDPKLNGTWVDNDDAFTFVFNNGNFVVQAEGENYVKGTYTTSGSTIKQTLTHIWGQAWDDRFAAKWYSKAELVTAGIDAEEVDAEFEPVTYTYSISGNRLTLTDDEGDSFILTKR